MAEKWEYHKVTSDSPLEGYELNRRGDRGWELVSYVLVPGRISSGGGILSGGIHQSDHKHIYTFKRPKRKKK